MFELIIRKQNCTQTKCLTHVGRFVKNRMLFSASNINYNPTFLMGLMNCTFMFGRKLNTYFGKQTRTNKTVFEYVGSD